MHTYFAYSYTKMYKAQYPPYGSNFPTLYLPNTYPSTKASAMSPFSMTSKKLSRKLVSHMLNWKLNSLIKSQKSWGQ